MRKLIAPIVLLIFGIFYFCLRILGTDLAFIPGDLGDARFINYLLEHGYSFLKGEVSFWDAPFMYPYKNVTAISDNMLGTLPVYALLRFLNFSMETSYQLWWITICALNFMCAFIVLRKFTDNTVLSAAFAYVFAFGFFNINHLNYMQMIIRFNVPIVIYCAYRLIESPHRKYLSGYVFALVFQFYCVMYTGFFLLYSSLLFICLYAHFAKKKPGIKFYFQKENLLNTGFTVGVGVILMGLLMYPYVITAMHLGFRSYNDSAANLPTIGSYFFSTEASYTWRFLFKPEMVPHENWWLQNIFAGIIPILCFIIPVVFLVLEKKKKNALNYLLLSLVITCTVFFVLLTRTEEGLTFYRLLFHLPGMNSMRVPTRFIHVQLFPVLLAGAIFFMKQKKWIIYGLAFICIVDNLFDPTKFSRTAKAEIQNRKNALVENIRSYDYRRYKAIAWLPDSIPPYMAHLDAMTASQALKINCVNGYSSACPGDFGGMFSNCNEEGLDKWLKAMNIPREDILIIR